MSENLIKYTTCKLIDNVYYNQWVSENTDTSKNTASLLPTSNQNGKRIYVYSNDTKIIDIYLMTSNIDNKPLETYDDGAIFINNDENIYQVTSCYTDEDNVNDFVLYVLDEELSITLTNFTTATENTMYNIDEYSWKYENVKVPEYEVTLYLNENEIILDEYLFNSSFITNMEIKTNLITAIPESCFSWSLALNNVEMPETITSLGVASFAACMSLFTATCKATTPPTLSANSFTTENATLYVPAKSVEAYKASDWNDYFSTIEAIPEPVYGFNLDGMIDTDYMKEF